MALATPPRGGCPGRSPRGGRPPAAQTWCRLGRSRPRRRRRCVIDRRSQPSGLRMNGPALHDSVALDGRSAAGWPSAGEPQVGSPDQVARQLSDGIAGRWPTGRAMRRTRCWRHSPSPAGWLRRSHFVRKRSPDMEVIRNRIATRLYKRLLCFFAVLLACGESPRLLSAARAHSKSGTDSNMPPTPPAAPPSITHSTTATGCSRVASLMS